MPPHSMAAVKFLWTLGRYLRRMDQKHPEWWVMLSAATAWAFLVVRHAQAADHHHAPAPGGGPDWPGLAAMIVAMMLPLMRSGVREAAFSGPSPRRHWSIMQFLLGYLMAWIPAMLLIDAGWKRLLTGGTTATVGMMFVAALWELAPLRQRQGQGCGTGRQIHPRHGFTAGIRCVASCWALMAVCVAFTHDVRVMAALFCVQLIARSRPSIPPAAAAAAVLVVCLGFLAMRIAVPHA